jgi:hypothetical protein
MSAGAARPGEGEVAELVSHLSGLIGDPPLGPVRVAANDTGGTTVTYQVSRGIYVIPDAGSEPVIIFGDAEAGQARGVFNVAAQTQDENAVQLIGAIIPPLRPLSFVIGFQNADPDGVNWKRFSTAEGEITLLTRVVPDPKRRKSARRKRQQQIRGEIVGPDWVVGFRARPDGVADEIGQLPESRLAPDVADSLAPPATVTYTDPQEQELQALLPEDLWDAMRATLDAFLAAEPLAAAAPPGAVLEGAAACEFLERCMRWMVAEAARAATATSSAHWLYLLRRLPPRYLAGQQPGTQVANQFTAEVLSALAGGDAPGTLAAGNAGRDETFQFPVGADLIPALVRLLSCARLRMCRTSSTPARGARMPRCASCAAARSGSAAAR